MKILLEDLQKLLLSEIENYQKLYSTLQQEKKLILDASIDELNRNNKKKEVIILQIKLLDEACLNLLNTLRKKIPGNSGSTSFTEVLDKVHDPQYTSLKKVHAKLLKLAHAVKEHNSENQRLIGANLRIVRGSLSFLTSLVTSGNTFYEGRGQLKQDNIVRPMLREEA